MFSLAMLWVVIIFVATLVALIYYHDKTARIFGLALCALYLSGAATTDQLLASFSNPGLVTLILLMICSVALEKTDFLRVMASKVIQPSYRQTLFRLFGSTVLASAFLNNTAVVSSLLSPVKNNPYHPASRLLILISYFSIIGGTLTLIGTSTNMIVNSLLIDAGYPSLSFFDFTLVGLGVVIGCGAMMLFCSSYLPKSELTVEQPSDYLIDAKITAYSPLIGKTIEENGLRHLESLFLVELVRGGRLISPVAPSEVLKEGDHLIFNGDVNKLLQVTQIKGLQLFEDDARLLKSNLTEVLVKPDSYLIGKTLKSTGFRAKFNAAVVALKRDGQKISGKLGEVVIQSGDFLVLAVGHDFHTRKNLLNNFVMVSGVEPDQVLEGSKGRFALMAFITAISVSALGLVEFFQALVALIAVYIFSGCLTGQEILRRLPVQLWLIITAALLFSQAANTSGLYELMSHWLNEEALGLSPWWALCLVYIVTWLLTELVTNNAAAALMFPIGLGIANSFGVDPMPFVMVVAFGASASFISPYGYQTNLIVYNAGQYKLADFARLGVPVALLYGVIVMTLIPMVYGF
jgi:di/tricarboxylate transporter